MNCCVAAEVTRRKPYLPTKSASLPRRLRGSSSPCALNLAWKLFMDHWNHRQVLDCGDEACAVAALVMKRERSGWTN